MCRLPDRAFWRGRKVLVTGHTGFKGAWLGLMLTALGAEVTGVALAAAEGAMFPLVAPRMRLDHHVLDIRDAAGLAHVMHGSGASVVLHLAAQALVPAGFADPAGTFGSNLDGTINVLEAMRGMRGVAAVVMVTTDKVYRNDGAGRRFVEGDPLGGDDPYSASKAAAELAVASWRHSFAGELPPVATARAGNVIGGGDFAPTRLVPDLVRALDGAPLVLRHPDATRPWQHVLDVLKGYLLQAEDLAARADAPGALNFGPEEREELSVREMIAIFEAAFGTTLPWRHEAAPAEAPRLALDASAAAARLGWRPRLDRGAAMAATAAWYRAWRGGADMGARCMDDVMEALA